MLIQLAIMGLLAAMVPLTIVWVSSDSNKYRKLVWVTAFLTFDLIMFGAFTRLTDSGLGCPDWPGCYGHANPLQAHEHISAAEAAMPTGPVTVAKAWIEMIHRYLAMGVGVLIMAMLAIAWRRWLKSERKDRAFHPRWPTILFGFVCLQGAFGAWTVTLKLQPVIVTMHLLLGMLLLSLLTWLGERLNASPPIALTAPLKAQAALALALVVAQIALGGWVSTNYAALACTNFPLCHGEVLPEMDFANAFALWRELGRTGEGSFLPYPALTAIHWTHRLFAFAVLAAVGATAFRARRIDGLRATAGWVLAVLAMQFMTGLSTIFFSWPLALAVVHNGGAAALVALLTMMNYRVGTAIRTEPNRVVAGLSPA